MLADEFRQQFFDLSNDDRRQSFGRFIQHQQQRVLQQGAGDSQHLLFAARQLAGVVAPAGEQPGEGFVNAGGGPSAAAFAQAQMFIDRQRRPQAPPLGGVADAARGDAVRRQPGDFFAAKTDGTATHRQQTHNPVAQRGFAHSVAPDHRISAMLNRQVDTLQCVRLAIIDVQSANLQHRRSRRSMVSAAGLSHVRAPDKVAALPGRFRCHPGSPRGRCGRCASWSHFAPPATRHPCRAR